MVPISHLAAFCVLRLMQFGRNVFQRLLIGGINFDGQFLLLAGKAGGHIEAFIGMDKRIFKSFGGHMVFKLGSISLLWA